MKHRIGQAVGWAVLAGLVALLAAGMLRTREPALFVRSPVAVMGTDCTLQAVAPAGAAERARQALAAAESELRRVEARLSVRLDTTEIAQLNAAPAKEPVKLSPASLEVLLAAREAHRATGGAFDVTCRPLIELRKQAGREGRLPTADQIAQARAQSSWAHIELQPDGAVKTLDTACVDLGGIAKGYAADQAAETMMQLGIQGGIAQAGGDTRCFGARPDGQPWRIAIRDPFHPQTDQPFATLRIRDGGVCTSGNYFRYVEIQGHRYSHIIDPRPGPTMGMPADAVPSVTVVAPKAITADVWATALSVLGAEGFSLLPPEAHIEAMVVEGTAGNFRIRMTEGFAKLLEEAPATQPAPVAAGGSEDH